MESDALGQGCARRRPSQDDDTPHLRRYTTTAAFLDRLGLHRACRVRLQPAYAVGGGPRHKHRQIIHAHHTDRDRCCRPDGKFCEGSNRNVNGHRRIDGDKWQSHAINIFSGRHLDDDLFL